MLTESNNNPEERHSCQSNQQRNCSKTLQSYFHFNLQCFINSNKNCLLQIQQQYKTINKYDQYYIETHLKEVYETACEKLQKQMLLRNRLIKQCQTAYSNEFQKKIKKHKKINELSPQSQKPQKIERYFFKFIKHPIDKKILLQRTKLSNIRSLAQKHRKLQVFTSNRCRKDNDPKLESTTPYSNTRYMQKLQRIKLQSTYTKLFFQQHIAMIEDEQDQPLEIKKIVNRIKAISAARNNFRVKNLLPCTNNKDRIRLIEEKKHNNFVSSYMKQQWCYKPKSKQKQRFLLNFNI